MGTPSHDLKYIENLTLTSTSAAFGDRHLATKKYTPHNAYLGQKRPGSEIGKTHRRPEFLSGQ